MTRTVYLKPWRSWKKQNDDEYYYSLGGCHDGRWALNPKILTMLPYLLRMRMCGRRCWLIKLYTDTFAAVLWIRLDPLK
jgi:hypothetical protein